MSTTSPPHYTAFRILLVVVMTATLVVAAWTVAHPPVLTALLDFLGLDPPGSRAP